jgi:hypothetical protein
MSSDLGFGQIGESSHWNCASTSRLIAARFDSRFPLDDSKLLSMEQLKQISDDEQRYFPLTQQLTLLMSVMDHSSVLAATIQSERQRSTQPSSVTRRRASYGLMPMPILIYPLYDKVNRSCHDTVFTFGVAAISTVSH